MQSNSIILASTSPRRKALMKQLGYFFETAKPQNVDEKLINGNTFEEKIMDLAYRKAKSVQHQYPDKLILGADTLVVVEDDILGKPKDEDDALIMLKKLSGKQHKVMTGCALIYNSHVKTFHSVTKVNFNAISDSDIKKYIETKEPFNKAGGYAIQGHAAKFIDCIEGDYYTVMGLPLSKVYRHLMMYENNRLF